MTRFGCRAMVVTCAVLAAAVGVSAQDAGGGKATAGFGASRVTIEVADAPVSQVAKLFPEQSGNLPFDIQESLRNRTVTLSVKDMSYWEAVDRFCEAAGLEYAHEGRGPRGELTLSRSKGQERIAAYAGPVVLRIGSLMRWRVFRPSKPNDPLNHYALCFARYEWEERLPVAGSETWVTRLVTPGDRDLIDVYATKGPRRLYNENAVPNRPAGVFSIYVGRPPDDVDRLAIIEGYFLFEFAVGKRELRIRDVQGAKPADDDGRIGLEVLKTRWIEDSLVTTLRMSVKAGATWPPLWAYGGPDAIPYGLFLEAPDAKRYGGVPTTAEPNLAEKLSLLRERRADADAPSQLEISFRFYKLPRDVERWSLVWVVPETHDIRKYPFAMKDVPLR